MSLYQYYESASGSQCLCTYCKQRRIEKWYIVLNQLLALNKTQ